MSPKFLCGESYGGLRGAGLSDYLQDRHGMMLAGFICVSGVLNFATLGADTANDLPYSTFLSTLTATAHYHGKIQGDLERAEETRRGAERELAEYREQLAGAREEANRIIEEARTTAEQLRADLQAKAERDAAATVAKAQEEIRAERDRVFQELRGEVAEIAVGLAGRVVGESLDATAHQRLIDSYIDEVAGNGKR